MTISFTGNDLGRDSNGEAIQFGGGIVTQDATGTPQVSPLTVSSSVKTIVPPAGAIRFSVFPTLADLRIGDNTTLDGSAAGKGYVFVDQDTWAHFDCANGNNIYALRNASTDVGMHFYFTVLEA